MLRVSGLTAGYGEIPVLHDVTLEVAEGATVAVVGPNGAGKTTLARTIGGFTRVLGGRVELDGEDVTTLDARRRTLRGVAQVPEGRRLFPRLTVFENLEIAFFARRRMPAARRRRLLDDALEHFPVLADRRQQSAGTLSGGEQQMLAIARALLLEPKLLVLDEPSTGLAPVVRREIFEVLVAKLGAVGCACLLIEQRAVDALRIASTGYVLERGRVVHTAPAARILSDPELRATYVGT